MTPDRWLQIEAIFQEALERPAPVRGDFLKEACAGDDELQAETTSLIEALTAAGEFIEQPALAQDAHVLLGPQLADVGRDIGPYQIIERIGGGGMGEVYLAQDARLNRRVALKILPAYFVSDEQRLRRFQTEARAASALNHPNILTIYEVGESAGLHYIATEFIDGQTVRELTNSKSISSVEVLDIARQLLSGLGAAHRAGIVHRDIKPENIMRRGDGIVKILDFGIAKLLENDSDSSRQTGSQSRTEIGTVLGTVGYMSPEQARGLTVDERTDIWSTGVVLYEMLTGRAPFAGATRLDTMVAILEREPAPLNEITGEKNSESQIQTIINKSLRKAVDDRYQKTAEMLADLGQVSQTPILLAAEGSVGERHRVGTILFAVFLLAAIVFSVVLYQRSRQRNARDVSSPPIATKRYAQMNAAEQLAFIDAQEQRISAMMGDRQVKLNDEALGVIKQYVDWYVARNLPSAKIDDLATVYQRAVPYAPLIARSFAARKIPVVVGIYLPMIESEYKPCVSSYTGANGLFQLTPLTAKNYGVEPAEMCDAEKMTPAAAHYIADRMAELGEDSQSMTLVLLSYNTGEEWVRNSLRQLRDAGNYERNFWTLFANRQKLADFTSESVGYVPRFFAVAIIGENPQVFDLKIPPLSTLNGSTAEPRK